MQTGRKDDISKLEYSLLPPLGLEEAVKVLMFGKKKYAAFNWALGMDWVRLIDAIERHNKRILAGEDIDSESGLSHAAHIAINGLFLVEYLKRGLGVDNRFKWVKENK